jgi:hypothetical protein
MSVDQFSILTVYIVPLLNNEVDMKEIPYPRSRFVINCGHRPSGCARTDITSPPDGYTDDQLFVSVAFIDRKLITSGYEKEAAILK